MHFYTKITEVMEDLIVAIVALGILVVSVEYVQFFLDHRDIINYADMAQRLVLFACVVLFTSYYFVTYSAYFINKKNSVFFQELSAGRMIVLYILDLLAITTASWLYAVLLIGTLTSAPDNLPAHAADIDVSINVSDMSVIFMIMLIWHFIILIWYFVSGGNREDKSLHAMYTVLYVSLLILSGHVIQGGLIVWAYILCYLCLIVSLYVLKGIPDIEAALLSQKDGT